MAVHCQLAHRPEVQRQVLIKHIQDFLNMANFIYLVMLMRVSFAYSFMVGETVPAKFALYINLMLFPCLIGAVGAWVIQAPLLVKFLLLMLIPLSQLIYFGGDPGKPEE